VIYDDDDPWNQTAADNAEWLIRFKRDVGLLSKDEGPGLPHSESSWQVAAGGSGFCPPYINPKKDSRLPGFGEAVDVNMEDKVYKVHPKTAEEFVRSLESGARFAPPGSVFCSRDLEIGLAQLVKSELAKGIVPSDEQLRAKGREILGVEKTAADDVELLEKFKSLHGISNPSTTMTEGTLPDYSLPNFTDDVSMLAEFDLELGAMDLSTDFSTGVIDPNLNTSLDPTTQDSLGELRDYSDAYRVSAATASPLRRRASEKLARGVGGGPALGL